MNELQFLIYNTPEENISINAVIKDETSWLTQKAMAELFNCTTDNISLHSKNIFADGELEEKSTTEEISVVQKEGKGKTACKYDILQGKGSISKQLADQKTITEYDAFNKTQKINSVFVKGIKKLLEKGGEIQ